MAAADLVLRVVGAADCCPWAATAGRAGPQFFARLEPGRGVPDHNSRLYTPEQRRRRDASPWTIVQAVLAPVQFAVFLMSAALVARYLLWGEGLTVATASVVLKTLVLYTIMITGAFWERAVFGRFLFAQAFFWEDVFSILVLGLHTAYLAALVSGAVDPRDQMLLAVAAYVAYLVNATQFVLKLRAARLEAAAA